MNQIMQYRQGQREELLQQFQLRYQGSDASDMKAFVEQYLEAVPAASLSDIDKDTLYGSTLCMWDFVRHSAAEPVAVKVFNPDLECDGYAGGYTVVEMLYDELPFVATSLRRLLHEDDIAIHNSVQALISVDGKNRRLAHVEIDRQTGDENLSALAARIHSLLKDLQKVSTDFDAMRELMGACADQCLAVPEFKVSAELLQWLAKDNFIFLAARMYTQNSKQQFRLDKKASLGLSSEGWLQSFPTLIDFDALGEGIHFVRLPERSVIHRDVYPHCVVLQNEDVRCVFLGLFAATVYREELNHIPWLHDKLQNVWKALNLQEDTVDGRKLEQLLATHPRDELFYRTEDELVELFSSVLGIENSALPHVYNYADKYSNMTSCYVYTPRERYSTALREKYEGILKKTYATEEVRSDIFFSESQFARTLFQVKPNKTALGDDALLKLQDDIQEAARSWTDKLSELAVEYFGESKAATYCKRYQAAFPLSYQEDYNARQAVVDIQYIEQVRQSNDLSLSFYRQLEQNESSYHLRLFHPSSALALSLVLPYIENLGFYVQVEQSHPVSVEGDVVWMHDFTLSTINEGVLDVAKVRSLIEDAFINIWHGACENDGLNRLIISAAIGWRDVALLRTYAHYFKQTGFPFSQSYIEDVLLGNTDLTRCIAQYFSARFSPAIDAQDKRQEQIEKEQTAMLEKLQAVDSLDEDRVFRRFIDVINATLRTNFFQPDNNGILKSTIAIKLSAVDLDDIPLPKPQYEIFICSPTVEGVHLRGGRLARGGLRWSDRREDFRTEILGLVKAQQVKNAVIVPVGAKGGFVCKKQAMLTDRNEIMEEGIRCYKEFIGALIDVTDNVKGGENIPPKSVVCWDEPDAYLVVAADKGTAAFSDIANSIAIERDFWLGDAFASGGSDGYDHKKMGITARGAWVSVQRHFREKGIDIQNESVTAVGIGDMSGDVFGNGMLLSKQLKLVAAFNHLHIFIDPDPDPEASWEERQRLFQLPRSNWEDYNAKLISKGGGIFSRKSKAIPISEEMQQAFDIAESSLPPHELIQALLKSPIDLIWNGGIGTYIKAQDETHLDVGDKANDTVRVNACEVKAKVVGEGGNLGLTQRARIEFCESGGVCYTDFIDNAGGVKCSDTEVNTKVLLQQIQNDGELTLKQRNNLLEKMTDEVAYVVLQSNYRQVQGISLSARENLLRMKEYHRLILDLQTRGKLDPELEYLPDADGIAQMISQGKSLSLPEISVLVSYAKADLKDKLLESPLQEDELTQEMANMGLPKTLISKFSDYAAAHPLIREMAATELANDVVNTMGPTFIQRMEMATSSSATDIARAYKAAKNIFDVDRLWSEIEAQDYTIKDEDQAKAYNRLRHLLRRSTRWILRNHRAGFTVDELVSRYKDCVTTSVKAIDSLIDKYDENFLSSKTEWLALGLSEELSRFLAGTRYLYSSLGIAAVADREQMNASYLANMYFKVGEELELRTVADMIDAIHVQNHWQALAREAYRDDLEWQQCSLAASLLRHCGGEVCENSLQDWLDVNATQLNHWKASLYEVYSLTEHDYAIYAVLVRELMSLAQNAAYSGKE